MSPTLPRLVDGFVDLDAGLVHRDEAPVALSPVELALLQRLARDGPAPVSRHVLAEAVWGDAELPRRVDFAVRRLRAKLEVDPRHPRHLLTVHGEGYAFVPAGIDTVAEPAAPSPRPRIGRWQVDPTGRRLLGPGEARDLTAKEGQVLAALLEARGEPVPREALLLAGWGSRRRGALRYVDQVVLRLRRKIEEDASTPVWITSVAGVGYRLEEQAGAEPVTEPATVHTRLVGRDDLLSGIRERLAPGVTVLLGPGGAGKTRLARAVHDHEGGCWVELADGDAGEVVPRVARALGMLGEPDADQVAARLARVAVDLVILDNVEHVAETVASLLGRWTREAPTTRWLLTSRVRPDVRAVVVRVSGLGEDDAVALFTERARDAGCTWAFDEADQRIVRCLVRRLDGLPLALELAAGRAALLDAPSLLARLDASVALLSGGLGRPERHRSLASTLRWSWDLLEVELHEALATLATFHEPFTLADAEALLDADPDVALERVGTLESTSWLRPTGDGRFLLSEVVRRFVRDAHPSPDAARRHAVHVARMGQRLAIEARLTGDEGCITALGARRSDLEAAVAWGTTHDPSTGCQALVGLAPLLDRRGETRRLLSLCDALPADGGWKDQTHGRALLRAGELARASQVLGGFDAERDDLAAEIGNTFGFVLWRQGHPERSARVLDEALQAAHRTGWPAQVAAVLSTRGTTLGHRDPARGEALLLRALDHAREAGATYEEGRILGNLANLCLREGRDDAAERLHTEALGTWLGLGDRRGLATTQLNLGNVRLQRGDAAGASEAYTAAVQSGREIGMVMIEAVGLSNLAMAQAELGDLDDAEASARQAAHLQRRSGSPIDAAIPETTLGLVHERRGHLAPALASLERTMAVMQSAGRHTFAAPVRASLAAVLAASGRLDEARAALEDARQLRAPEILCTLIAHTLDVHADHPDAVARARAALEAMGPHMSDFSTRWAVVRLERLVSSRT